MFGGRWSIGWGLLDWRQVITDDEWLCGYIILVGVVGHTSMIYKN